MSIAATNSDLLVTITDLAIKYEKRELSMHRRPGDLADSVHKVVEIIQNYAASHQDQSIKEDIQAVYNSLSAVA